MTQDGYALKYAASLRGDKEVVLAAVTQGGYALDLADASLRGDKEVVLAAVMQDGWVLDLADASLRGDKEVVLAAVTQYDWVLQFAGASLQLDLEVQLVAARHKTATAALKLVRQLRHLRDWKEQEAALDRAVELLAAFPCGPAAPKVNQQLHALVEGMVKRAYQPGAKRDRDAFERDFAA